MFTRCIVLQYDFEFLKIYEKDVVLKDLEATEVDGSNGEVYQLEDGTRVAFITFGEDPNEPHMCSKNNISWNKARGGVVVGLVRGDYVKNTSDDVNKFLYLGLLGNRYNGLRIDWSMSRQYLKEQFGAQILNCKINRYGMSIKCGRPDS